MPSFQFKEVFHDQNEIDYELADRVSRSVTLADIAVTDGDQVKIAAAYQFLIQGQIDSEIVQSDLPLDDPERDFRARDFEDLYPAGNVFLERRGPNLIRVTRNEVVRISWDSVNSVYNVGVSTVG